MISDDQVIKDTLLSIAKKMIIAAKTAPKGRGMDNMFYAIVNDPDTIQHLSKKMLEIGNQLQAGAFIRDSKTILDAPVVVLLGTRIQSIGLGDPCGLCSYKNCKEREALRPQSPCIYNTGDLGIAIGSAVSIAMENRVDNRIMYTIGQAARALKLLGDDAAVVFGVPLSATAKNIFFERR